MKTERVTNLKRHATSILAELRKTQEPILITEHGQPSAYLVNTQDYEFMQRRLSLLEELAKGERAVLQNQVVSHDEAKERMKKWLK